MKVLGYHISDKEVLNSDGEVPGNLSIAEFLLRPKDDTIRIFFDLDYSMNFLLHSLKVNQRGASILVDTTKYHIPPYNLRYVPGRFMSIKRSNGFSYYSSASQYVKYNTSELALNPATLAERAKQTGEMVRDILKGLGIETTSLTSPARAYERSQVEFLFKEMQKSRDDEVRSKIIDSIGLEVFGRSWEKYLEVR